MYEDEIVDAINWAWKKGHITNDVYDLSQDDRFDTLVSIAASIAEEAYDSGRDAGQEDSYRAGYDEGRNVGYDEGEEQGYSVGYQEGRKEGWQEGYDEGCKANR